MCLWGQDYAEASKRGFFLAKIRHKDEGYDILIYVKFVLFASKCSIAILAGIFVYVFCAKSDKSLTTFDITIMDSPMVPYLLFASAMAAARACLLMSICWKQNETRKEV